MIWATIRGPDAKAAALDAARPGRSALDAGARSSRWVTWQMPSGTDGEDRSAAGRGAVRGGSRQAARAIFGSETGAGPHFLARFAFECGA